MNSTAPSQLPEPQTADSTTAAGSQPVALRAVGLSKRYGATQALADVSLDLQSGSVSALTGENGAGKSTLIRLLTGVEHPDQGTLHRNGQELRLHSRHDATNAGIFCVYQDQAYVPQFKVYEQMFLGFEHHFGRAGLVSRSRMRDTGVHVLEELGLTSIHAQAEMATLSPGARTSVALATVIATAQLLQVEHPVILLDEPTSALTVEELQFLIRFFDSLKSRSALMFVSHRVNEVLQWADQLHVLRDGRNAGTMTRETATPERMHAAMGGRHPRNADVSGDASRTDPTRTIPTAELPAGRTAYSIKDVTVRPHAPDSHLSVRPGQIVGLAGVEGSGKEQFLRLCAGLPVKDGQAADQVTVGDRPVRRRQRDLLDAGVVYLSGDRQYDGVFSRLSITENMAVSRRVVAGARGLVLNHRAERSRAQKTVEALSVKAATVDAPMTALSGGNQQKVLLGRCLLLEPDVMLLDNVTRGVDVGAKSQIYRLFESLTDQGMSLVLASDDLDELVAIADRVVVFKAGAAIEEFVNERRDLNPLTVLAAMV